jgi:hypothetical protein
MKKLILKWLGLTDLKGRVEYCEALSKDNKKEILFIMDNYIQPYRLKLDKIDKEISERKDVDGYLRDDLRAVVGVIGDVSKLIKDQQNQINTLCMQVDELNVEISKLKPKTTKPTTRVKPIVKTHDKSPKKSTKK